MSTLERAIEIAVQAHRGQLDKAGAPYILHPIRVMLRVSGLAERLAAILHDVVEDSAWTLDQLAAEGFPPEVVAAVDALTRREHESYEEFVRRSGAHPIARQVKLADLTDNVDLSRIAAPDARDYERIARYERALAYLRSLPSDS